MVVVTDLLTVAKKVNNYLINATTTWTSTTTQKWTVPVGKRWFIVGGKVHRDVSSTIVVVITETGDGVIMSLGEGAAATGAFAFPSQASSANNQHMPYMPVVDVGEHVLVTLGTAQSTAAYVSCVVLEVDV